MFHTDSEAALAIFAKTAEAARADERWPMALYGSRLLDNLGLDLPRKIAVVRRLREGFNVGSTTPFIGCCTASHGERTGHTAVYPL